MIIYRSKFLEVNYLERQHLMHFRWTGFAAHMDREGFYHEWLNFLGYRLHKRSRKFYIDLRTVEQWADATFFEWLFTYIIPKMASFNASAIGFLVEHPAAYGFVPREKEFFKGRKVRILFERDPQVLMEKLEMAHEGMA
jgi:hypothetical protein